MVKKRVIALAVMLIVHSGSHAAPAAGLSVPDWLKFGKQETTRPAVHKKSSGKQMLQGKPVKRTAEKKSSMLTSVSNAPKKLMASTKNAFSFNRADKSKPKKATGQQRVRRKKTTVEEETPSFFSRWFKPEPAEPPRSVGEWMSLPRNDL